MVTHLPSIFTGSFGASEPSGHCVSDCCSRGSSLGPGDRVCVCGELCVCYRLRAVAPGADADARASPGHRAESSGPRGSWYLVQRTCAHSQGGPRAQAASGAPHVSTVVTEHAGRALPGCPALSCAAGRGQATTVHVLQSCRRRGAAGSRPRVDLWVPEGRALARGGQGWLLAKSHFWQMKRGPRPPRRVVQKPWPDGCLWASESPSAAPSPAGPSPPGEGLPGLRRWALSGGEPDIGVSGR